MRPCLVCCMAAVMGMVAFPRSADAAPRSVAATNSDIRPLLIGQVMPDVAVVGLDGKSVSLKKIVTEKPTVLVVFRGGWCPFCSAQLAQLKQATAPLAQLGWQIVGVGADPVAKLVQAAKEEELSYKLFSDERGAAFQALGLAYKAGIDAFGSDTKLKAWLAARDPKIKGPPVLPVPAVYLIHRSGLIVYQYVNIDYSVRLSGEVLLTAARAYADED